MRPRLLALLLAPAALLAQDQAPIQMPTNLFFETDFVVVEPKNTVWIGVRSLSGAESTFQGFGNIESTQLHGDIATRGIARGYHDGAVNLDARVRQIDDGNGNVINVPVTPDGKTNNWQMLDSDQALPDGNVSMSTYKATLVDSGVKIRNPRASYGLELALRRELRKGTRFSFNFNGGVSLNGISSKMTTFEDATVTRLTDTYSLDGAPVPAAPYPGAAGGIPLVDINGFPVLDSDGQQASTPGDPVVLLVQEPLGRTESTAVQDDSVTNRYNLRGAFFTFRAGPTIDIPFGSRFQASFSAGPALAYSGTTYTVSQDFQPETGGVINETVTSSKNRLLPGFYADASLQLLLTERAGFYLGAVFQNTGQYSQNVDGSSSNYSTNVSLKSLQGYQMGMNVKF